MAPASPSARGGARGAASRVYRALLRIITRVLLSIWRLLDGPPGPQRPGPARTLAEFRRVNEVMGTEPIKPELSGLRLPSTVGLPGRVTRLMISLAYRWEPSQEYLRRQEEMQRVNRRAEQRADAVLPPVLIYPPDEDLTMVPSRVTSPFDAVRRRRNLPVDVKDLAVAEQAAAAQVIAPRVHELEREYFASDRHLLPRECRRFLRSSPYPRIAAALGAVLVAVAGTLWMMDIQRAEAVAATNLRVAREAFERELLAAKVYGVDPRFLHSLQIEAGTLRTLVPPGWIVITHARAGAMVREAHGYAFLLGRVRYLERRAMAYWTWRAGLTYSWLLVEVQEVRAGGLHVRGSPPPACRTPACFGRSVTRMAAQTAWLRQTAETLHIYGAAVAKAPVPAAAAEVQLQKARSLSALPGALPNLPVRTADLDGAYAAAGSTADFTRVGALARYDVDRLEAHLVRSLSPRAVVVSTADGTATCYAAGRAIYRAPVYTDGTTPLGLFHVQARVAALPATYWYRMRTHYGVLPHWMALGDGIAMQGAPWRSTFGPAGGPPTGYAPDTPGSIDLPAGAAAFVYGWVRVGTEVVVY